MPEVAEAPTNTQQEAPVGNAGKTSLSQVWHETMTKLEKDNSEKSGAPDPQAKTEKPAEAKVETEKAAPDPKGAKTTALDAVLGDVSEITPPAAKDADEIPANAPAKTLRDAMERHRAESTRLKAELEKRSAPDPAVVGELETLRKERDSWKSEKDKYSKAITALDVRYSPEYQDKFVAGRVVEVDRAAAKLKAFGGDPAVLIEALSLPEGKLRSSALKEAIGELDELDRSKVIAAIDKVEALDEEAATQLQDPQKAWQQMTKAQHEAAQKHAEEANGRKAAEFERFTKALPGKFLLARKVPDDAEGAVEHNARVDSAIDRGKYLLSDKASYQDVLEAAAKAPFADWLQEELLNERKLRIATQKENAALQKAEPGVRGSGKPASSGAEHKKPSQLYHEKMAELSGRQI